MQTQGSRPGSQHGSDDDHEADDTAVVGGNGSTQEQSIPAIMVTSPRQSNSAATNIQVPGIDSFVNVPAARVPTTQPDFPNAAVVIGGVGPYQQRFGTLEEGCLAFYKTIRSRKDFDKTLIRVTSKVEYYVRGVYDCIRNLGDSVSPLQQEMINSWEDLLKELDDKHTLLLEVSHMVVKSVIDLYQFGDNLRPDQIRRLGPTKLDGTMTATERMERICAILRDTKTVCIDLLSGKDEITKFVAAPIAYEKRKYPNNSKNNDTGVRSAPISAYILRPLGQDTTAFTRLTPPTRPPPQQRPYDNAPEYTSLSNIGLGGLHLMSTTTNRPGLQPSYFAQPEVIREHNRLEAQRKRTASKAFGAESADARR